MPGKVATGAPHRADLGRIARTPAPRGPPNFAGSRTNSCRRLSLAPRPRAAEAGRGVWSYNWDMRRRLALCSLVLLAFGASLAPIPALAQGAVLRVGMAALPSTLDPATALDGAAAMVARQVYDTLVQYREGGSDV